jgi:hypothetical protein
MEATRICQQFVLLAKNNTFIVSKIAYLKQQRDFRQRNTITWFEVHLKLSSIKRVLGNRILQES